MTLTTQTYGELKNAVEDWLRRTDLTDAQLSDVVLMFENHANRVLRVRQMEASSSITTTSGAGTLPTDYLSWRTLTWGGDINVELEYVHPHYLRAAYPNTDAGVPKWFTIEGSTITVRPVDDDNSYTLRSWQKIPDLNSQGAAGTNWLLSAHPDVYLSGSLYCAYKFLRDVEGATYYKALMDEGLAEIARLSEVTKAPTAARPVGAVP